MFFMTHLRAYRQGCRSPAISQKAILMDWRDFVRHIRQKKFIRLCTIGVVELCKFRDEESRILYSPFSEIVIFAI